MVWLWAAVGAEALVIAVLWLAADGTTRELASALKTLAKAHNELVERVSDLEAWR